MSKIKTLVENRREFKIGDRPKIRKFIKLMRLIRVLSDEEYYGVMYSRPDVSGWHAARTSVKRGRCY